MSIDPIQQWYALAQEPYDGSKLPAQQGQDGVGHFNYYDRDRSLSFQWDGNPEEEVTVSQGGYGESVRWYFTAREFQSEDIVMTATSVAQSFTTYFKNMCDEWVRDVEEGMANGDFDNTPVIL